MCLKKIKSKTHQKNTNYKSTEYKARKKILYGTEIHQIAFKKSTKYHQYIRKATQKRKNERKKVSKYKNKKV